MAVIRLALGGGSYFPTEESLKAYLSENAAIPVYKFEGKHQLLVEDTELHHREDEEPAEPTVWEEEYAGADEYAVSTWFRWVETKRVPWEGIFTLTYNEPEHYQNAKRAGDRVLSLLQYADGRLFFSTYTNIKDDGFEYIYHESSVPELIQGSWIYAYFGYSRQHENAISYIKYRSGEDFGILQAVHRVPKYLALFKAKDTFHTPFNGKIAYFELLVGPGSYHEKNFDNVNSYVKGLNEFAPAKPITWNHPEDQFAVSASEEADAVFEEWEDGDTAETNIDGISEYGFGFWFRYLTTFPEHLYEKP